jgi:anti-sigma B factor antagonist
MSGTSILDIRFSQEADSVHRLGVTGELDAETGPRLLASLLQDGLVGEVRLDLSGVTFIDCSGLSILLRGLREARRHGHELAVDPDVSHPVERMIEMTGVGRLVWP